MTIHPTLAAIAIAAMGLATGAAAAPPSAAPAFCAMTRAQGEVQHALLGAADAFAHLGDPATGTRAVTVGVRKSLSRTLQAGTVAQLAEAQCDAYRLEEQLARQAERVEQRSELQALRALEPRLRAALAAAEQNVAREERLLAARNATLADLRGAHEQVEQLRAELAQAVRRQGQLAGEWPAENQPLEALAQEAGAARARVAELSARLTAQSGWDVAVSAGTRSHASGSERGGAFVAVTATMSLGQSRAGDAATRVGGLAQDYLRADRDGALQTLLRARDAVRAMLAGEALALAGLEQRQALLARTAARLDGVDTTDGLRLRRTLKVEALGVDARLAAARERAASLQAWLALNGG